MTDLTANNQANLGRYANLISTRDLIEQHQERLYQGSWYHKGLYCFAGFAWLVHEGKTVGDEMPNQDPDLGEWLGLSPEDYELICHRIENADEVLDALDAVVGGRTLYDSEGYDSNGFDADGLDVYGYDQYGFDVNGFDEDGFDANGFDENGFDEYGYDANGFDLEGFDGEGFDSEGFDSQGYDRKGFDRDGFDCEGFDRDGLDAEGYDWLGFDCDGFNREGLDCEGRMRDYLY